MRKSIILAACAVTAGLAFAAGYSVLSLPSPGEWSATGIGVAKVKALYVEGGVPDDGTVIVSRVSADGSATNALLTRTVASGAVSDELGSGTNIYIMAGDRLLRSGTVTNESRCILILEE